MINGRLRPPRGTLKNQRTPGPFRDRLFAWKLLLGLAAGLVVCLLVFALPAIYFVEQNYDIFLKLAYDVKPGLVHHLEREIVWLRSFLVAGSLGMLIVGLFFARRVVRHLVEPLEKLEDHLQQLSTGEWNSGPLELPSEETYRTLFLTYGFFHRSLRNQAQNDLKLLEKISVDPAHREGTQSLRALLLLYRHRLGTGTASAASTVPDNVTAIGAKSAGDVPSRRVS